MYLLRKLTVLLLFLMIILTGNAGGKKPLIYKIDINTEIGSTSRIYLKRGMEEANQLHADAILLHMNTYGGHVDAADSMRTAILYSPIPVYVFIDNNAASAGALISIACDKIYMRKGANIGAATVVDQSGSAMPDKYQSYMRSMMRSTAEAHGQDTIISQRGDTTFKWVRDPLIAEAMVDDRVIVPNLIDSGKVLTFTAGEAQHWGFCDGIAETPDEVITQHLGFTDYDTKTYKPNWLDKLKGFLTNPIFQSILISIIIGGIYFELQTPGMGFPSIAALIAAILYLTPLYIDGLAANWEILIFLIGLILIALEVFVIPGFGVAGILGIILVAGGLVMSLLDNTNFDFQGVSTKQMNESVLTVVAGLVLGFVLMIWISNRIGRKGMFRHVALQTDLEDAAAAPDLRDLIGQQGVTTTILRPSGKVEIDGEVYDGISEIGFIEKGKRVVVVRYENAQVYVETLR